MKEVWKDIPLFEGCYQASSTGRIKSMKRKSWLGSKKDIIKKQILNKYGYYKIQLYKNNNHKNFLVHQLIAMTFLKKQCSSYEVNHIDGNPKNNKISNLEYVSKSVNNAKKYVITTKNGYSFSPKGSKLPFSTSLSVGKSAIFIGTFKTIKEAQEEHMKAYFEWYGFLPKLRIIGDEK